MKLTSFTDYTLRALMYLALHRDRLCTIQGIATAYGISESHLMKVVHHLGKSGVVESLRGKGGGIRLARLPEEIRIGDVVREAEGDGAIVECFGEGARCRLSRNCKLAGVLESGFVAFYERLNEFSLADLVSQPQGLRRLLLVERV